MEEKLKEIINNLKSITEKYMLGNYSQWNNLKEVLAEDIKELEKALEEREELKKKIKAFDKALELLKQKRDNAQNDFKNLKCEKENVGMHIALKNQIDTYADCIATIEIEMGRK